MADASCTCWAYCNTPTWRKASRALYSLMVTQTYIVSLRKTEVIKDWYNAYVGGSRTNTAKVKINLKLIGTNTSWSLPSPQWPKVGADIEYLLRVYSWQPSSCSLVIPSIVQQTAICICSFMCMHMEINTASLDTWNC